MRFNDAILGAIFIAVAAFMIQQSVSFPGFPGQDYGPALFPRIIAGGIILCSVLLVYRGLRARSVSGEAWLAFDDWTRVPRHLMSFVLIIAAMVAYILFSERIGFIISAFVLQFGLFLWFGVRPLMAVIVAAISTAVVQFFFVDLLRVPLPRGLLDSVL